jgi:hypothetical protein
MKTLNISETQHVTGGVLARGHGKELFAAAKPATPALGAVSGLTVLTFSPSHHEGMTARLTRFDKDFMAPNEALGEDQPLFAGLNDQGGA